MDIFQKARINPTTLTTHSGRSATTLNSFQKGLWLKEISKAAGWRDVKTSGKFYNKSIEDTKFGTFLTEKNMQIIVYLFQDVIFYWS